MLKISQEFLQFGSTPVENLFFTDYLAGADGDCVKVYLACLFHAQQRLDLPTSQDLAELLNLTPSQVEKALRYWERRHLLERGSGENPSVTVLSIAAGYSKNRTVMAQDHNFINFSEAIYALFHERRKIGPADIALAYDWVQDMGLNESTVLMMIAHLIHERGVQFSFQKHGQKLAVELCERGLFLPEEAESFFAFQKQVTDGAKGVLKAFGLSRQATKAELDLYRHWLEELRFDAQDILEATEEVTKATNPSFAYLNGILEGIKKRSNGQDLPLKAMKIQQDNAMASVKQFISILGLRISPQALQATFDRLKTLASEDVIFLAAERVKLKQGKLEDVEFMLTRWQERGLHSVDAVQRQLALWQDALPFAKEMWDAMGLDSAVTEKDIDAVIQWQQILNRPLLLHAAAQARSAKQKLPYLKKVLAAYQEKGIKTIEEAMKQSEAPQAVQQNKPFKEVAAHRYEQRAYTESELAHGNMIFTGED